MPHAAARMRSSILALLLILSVSLLSASPAWSHAQLLDTAPAQNSLLSDSPGRVSLRFNEPVSALVIRLIAPDGTQTDLTEIAENGETLGVPLPKGLVAGTYVLSWRVASLDAHPVAGSLVFSIGRETGAKLPEPGLPQRLVMCALWAVKVAMLAALAFGTGGAVFNLAAPLPEPGGRLAMVLCLAGLIAAPLSLGLQGLDALGLPLSGLLQLSPWSTASGASYGLTVIAAVLAFGFSLVALSTPSLKWLAWAAWGFAAAAPMLSGHAGTAEPQWLTRPLVVLHIGGILFWTGALVPLWWLLKSGNDKSHRALTRFSNFIPFAVAALVFSGIGLAIIQLGAPGPAWLTGYGAILAAKLALLFLLFGLAIWNRLKLTVPSLAGNSVAQFRLRQSIRIEIVLVLIILALVAGWRFTPPPRALADLPQSVTQPLFVHAMDSAAMANVTVSSGQTGPVSIGIQVLDGSGQPVTPQALSVRLSAPDLGIEPLAAVAILDGDVWRIDDIVIPVSGTWHLALDIRMSRYSLITLQTDLEIP